MTKEALIDENVEHRSLREESWGEACKERWYLSQKAGCDQGEHALRLWVRQHWQGFRFWVELDRKEFGLLKRRDLVDARGLLDEIIEMVRCGAENLDILRWSRRTKTPAEQKTVKEILALININAHRLKCFFCDD